MKAIPQRPRAQPVSSTQGIESGEKSNQVVRGRLTSLKRGLRSPVVDGIVLDMDARTMAVKDHPAIPKPP